MGEFKFSCPQCGQRMLATDAHVGIQIHCPACRKLIVVPDAPVAAIAPPQPAALVIQRPAAPATSPAAMPAATRYNPPPAPKTRSRALRTAVVFSVVIIVCAASGGGAWYFYSRHKAKVAEGVSAPGAGTADGAPVILAKVQKAYANLQSLSVEGTSAGVMDISAITAADLNPNQSAADKSATVEAAKLAGSVTNMTGVSIKLARPDSYRIEGISKMAVGQVAGVNFTVAVWSSGETNFVLLGRNYAMVPDRQSAFAKTAASGKLVTVIPKLFFDEADAWAFTQDWGQTEDESLDGQDCCTLTAKIMGQQLKIWVSKTSYMILKSKITIGGPVSDADIDAAFNSPGVSANYTQAQIDQMKIQEKQKSAMMAKIRGSITETYDNIQTNEAFTADDFIYPVPDGIRLNPAPLKSGSTAVISASLSAPGESTEARQRNACINNLRQIDAAKAEWALENHKKTGDTVTEDDLKPYIKLDTDGNLPKCPSGGTYAIGKIGESPTCSILGHVLP